MWFGFRQEGDGKLRNVDVDVDGCKLVAWWTRKAESGNGGGGETRRNPLKLRGNNRTWLVNHYHRAAISLRTWQLAESYSTFELLNFTVGLWWWTIEKQVRVRSLIQSWFVINCLAPVAEARILTSYCTNNYTNNYRECQALCQDMNHQLERARQPDRFPFHHPRSRFPRPSRGGHSAAAVQQSSSQAKKLLATYTF